MGEDCEEFLLFVVFVGKRKSGRDEFRVVLCRSVSEPSPGVGELCGVGSVVGGLFSSELVGISSLVDDLGRCVRRGYVEFGEREFPVF
jgi:hypothetical protein